MHTDEGEKSRVSVGEVSCRLQTDGLIAVGEVVSELEKGYFSELVWTKMGFKREWEEREKSQ